MANKNKQKLPIISQDFVEFLYFDWSFYHAKVYGRGVYVLDMIDTPYIKIGSTAAPKARHYGLLSSSPFDIKLAFFVTTGDGPTSHIDFQRSVKDSLKHYHARGEWFNCSAGFAIDSIKLEIDGIK